MKIGLRYGHSVNCSGANGAINEVDSCMALYFKVKTLLESVGNTVIGCNSSAGTQQGELAEGTTKANNNGVDVYITLHMNSASNSTARGVECWVYDTKSTKVIPIATKICNNIALLGAPNRGIKYGGRNYHDLSKSNMETIIVESLFVSNKEDAELYRNNTDKLARAIANGIDNRVSLDIPNPVEKHRNVIVYNSVPDKVCADFFTMILNSKGEDCVSVNYDFFSKGTITGNSIFAVGGSLKDKFKYNKLFSGINRDQTALDMLQHLKRY